MNKVFIVGLPRTGTTSISVALLDHGLKVAHTAYTKRAFELADVISDTPCFCDYRQLDSLFPHSKFIYLDRNLNDWIASIQRLLKKMQSNLGEAGHFNPVLKRCFIDTFKMRSTSDYLSEAHLKTCYLNHQESVFNYFRGRNDFLSIDVSEPDSLNSLLMFLGLKTELAGQFPKVNVGSRVDYWRNHKHPNKINSNAAGREHRKFFEYQQ